MNQPAKVRISAEIDAETYAVAHELARSLGQSDDAFFADAVRRFALSEAELLASLDQADADISAGAYREQADIRRWIETRRADRKPA